MSMFPGMPYGGPVNRGPMKPQMPRPMDYGHPLGGSTGGNGFSQPRPQAHIPENGPSLGGGTGPMQPRPGAGDPRMMLAQQYARHMQQQQQAKLQVPRSHRY